MQIMIFPALEANLNKSFFGNINKQISFKSLNNFIHYCKFWKEAPSRNRDFLKEVFVCDK